MTKPALEIYTDGSCVNYKDLAVRAQKGHGGWAFIVVEPRLYINGFSPAPQTNQTMEMIAVRNAMGWAVANGHSRRSIVIYSDSMYVIGGFQSGQIELYKEFDWDVPNGKLWKELYEAHHLIKRNLRFVHVKGHAGNKFNEMCDRMASRARKEGPKDEQ